MATYRIVFAATTTSELKFPDSTVATDGDLVVVLKDGQRVFGIPSKNLVAIERLQDAPPPAEPDGA